MVPFKLEQGPGQPPLGRVKISIKPRWSVADIPDLAGKVAIVTGANSGIGLEIALALARRGARVVLAARDPTRTNAAVERIRRAIPEAQVEAGTVDLADLATVRAFAAERVARGQAVDILVNNAGISGGPRRLSRDGLEMHFQVNHLAHFALTALLWPVLRGPAGSRVVTVSSDVASSGRIDFEDLQSERYRLVKAYAQSKLANLLFARELERRGQLAGAAVRSFACHPGVAKTNLLIGKEADWGRTRQGLEHGLRFAQMVLAQPAEKSALAALYQATALTADPDAYVAPKSILHGRGYPGSVPFPKAALDTVAAKRLWDVSAHLSGIPFAELASDGSG